MSPAEKRIKELLERWLASLEAHREYAALDDEAYWRVRKWVQHERPTRMIIDLAHQKTLELKAIVDSNAGDPGRLAEALELMAMLANLVGAQSLRRFIPLADPAEKPVEPSPGTSDTQRQRIPPGLREAAAQQPPPNSIGTGEHSHVSNDGEATAPLPRRRSHRAHARTATRDRTRSTDAGSTAGATQEAKPPSGPPSAIETGVMSDAVRLLKWGRSWHELPDAIARMSGRPAIDVVRQILRQWRTEIEERTATSE